MSVIFLLINSQARLTSIVIWGIVQKKSIQIFSQAPINHLLHIPFLAALQYTIWSCTVLKCLNIHKSIFAQKVSVFPCSLSFGPHGPYGWFLHSQLVWAFWRQQWTSLLFWKYIAHSMNFKIRRLKSILLGIPVILGRWPQKQLYPSQGKDISSFVGPTSAVPAITRVKTSLH